MLSQSSKLVAFLDKVASGKLSGDQILKDRDQLMPPSSVPHSNRIKSDLMIAISESYALKQKEPEKKALRGQVSSLIPRNLEGSNPEAYFVRAILIAATKVELFSKESILKLAKLHIAGRNPELKQSAAEYLAAAPIELLTPLEINVLSQDPDQAIRLSIAKHCDPRHPMREEALETLLLAPANNSQVRIAALKSFCRFSEFRKKSVQNFINSIEKNSAAATPDMIEGLFSVVKPLEPFSAEQIESFRNIVSSQATSDKSKLRIAFEFNRITAQIDQALQSDDVDGKIKRELSPYKDLIAEFKIDPRKICRAFLVEGIHPINKAIKANEPLGFEENFRRLDRIDERVEQAHIPKYINFDTAKAGQGNYTIGDPLSYIGSLVGRAGLGGINDVQVVTGGQMNQTYQGVIPGIGRVFIKFSPISYNSGTHHRVQVPSNFEREALNLRAVNEDGLIAPQILAIGAVSVDEDTQFFSIQTAVPGHDAKVAPGGLIRASYRTGEYLGRLHAIVDQEGIKSFQNPEIKDFQSQLKALTDNVENRRSQLLKNQYESFFGLIARLNSLSERVKPSSPLPSLIQGDVHFGNVILDGTRTGMVDWEFSALSKYPEQDFSKLAPNLANVALDGYETIRGKNPQFRINATYFNAHLSLSVIATRLLRDPSTVSAADFSCVSSLMDSVK